MDSNKKGYTLNCKSDITDSMLLSSLQPGNLLNKILQHTMQLFLEFPANQWANKKSVRHSSHVVRLGRLIAQENNMNQNSDQAMNTIRMTSVLF
jgi:hypothetical protein